MRSGSNDILLNSKGEWNGTRVPRLRLESEEKNIEQKDLEEEEIQTEERDRIKKIRSTWKKSTQNKRKCVTSGNEDDEYSEISDQEMRKTKIFEIC